jgi:hypothetical protein
MKTASKAAWESDYWKDKIASWVPDYLVRDVIVVTRIVSITESTIR